MIKHSELIINKDGTIFHLHLKPENISDTIILVGDPGRVEMIAAKFEAIEFSAENREFVTKTGMYNGKRLSVVSTGIGTDNIDIVVNELDALANIDLKTRTIKKTHKQLDFIRIGTSGGLQATIPVNSLVVTRKAFGFDGMLNFYANREEISDLVFEKQFKNFTNWDTSLPTPYAVNVSNKLLQKFPAHEFTQGVTISAPGFYGPQGRVIRLPLAVPGLNKKIEQFEFEGLKITNYEMESSAIYGLARLLGHQALTICAIIANRVTHEANEDYYDVMDNLVDIVLKKITN
ncbi:MAG: nucleoside phosphorylase [Chlorobi bacterium]|nr:nucleoside phosphorylase [Chlorobiota bacterium]